jgi:MOSC domain-containing protein YiiM
MTGAMTEGKVGAHARVLSRGTVRHGDAVTVL